MICIRSISNLPGLEKGPLHRIGFYRAFQVPGHASMVSRWHYGDHLETLKGTSRTLDEVDGAMELEDGTLSKASVMLFRRFQLLLKDVESDLEHGQVQKWICISSVMGDYSGA